MKDLHIQGYGGRQLPSWVGCTSYARLVTLKILSCEIRLLPSLGQLPSLEYLSISKCHNVAEIGAEFYGQSTSSIRPFSSSRVLKFEDMRARQKWSFLEGQEDCGSLPSLEKLYMDDCSRLQTDWNFRSNITELYVVGYKMSNPIWSAESPSYLFLGCEHVTNFPESRLPTTIISVRIDGLGNLKALSSEGFQHLTSLKELEIKYCPELQCILGETLPTSLKSLRIISVQKLKDLGKGFQHFVSLKKLSICHVQNILPLLEEGLPTTLTSLCIDDFENLEDLSHMEIQHLTSLKELKIRNCENQRRFPEEGLPPSLLTLRIEECPLLEQQCRRESGEDWPKIAHIPSLKIGIWVYQAEV